MAVVDAQKLKQKNLVIYKIADCCLKIASK
jgi:hypothetical protein